jgi:hypothetical protein
MNATLRRVGVLALAVEHQEAERQLHAELWHGGEPRVHQQQHGHADDAEAKAHSALHRRRDHGHGERERERQRVEGQQLHAPRGSRFSGGRRPARDAEIPLSTQLPRVW